MVIKPISPSGGSPDLSSLNGVEAATGAQSTSLASGVAASTHAASRAAVESALERVGTQIRAGEIGFAEGVSQIISVMAHQQVPAGIEGLARENLVREAEQVLGDDPRVAASVERLLRGSSS